MTAPAFLVSQSAPATTAGAGALGLFILLTMGLVTALLIANMSGRLKRLPVSYDSASVTETSKTAPFASPETKSPTG